MFSFEPRCQGLCGSHALVTAIGALARTESRGAHARTDYPARDDAHWLNRTLARWPQDANKPILSYEPVGLIDLPPGHRGYGKSESVEMKESIEEYNARVETAWRGEGALETIEPIGSRIQWGAWQATEGQTKQRRRRDATQ